MISKAAMRVMKNMKFGIYIIYTYDEDVGIDIMNGNDYWQDANKKEMNNVEVDFKFIYDGSKFPIEFDKIAGQLIFDVKFDLKTKSISIGGGHITQVSVSISYYSFVSRDSVRIILLIAELNDLDINMCDIENAYLNADNKERLWFTAGSEWVN